MSATLWINTDAEETIELGEAFTLLQVHAEIAHACGEDYSKFPELFEVVGAVLDQEDVDPEWLEKVSAQADAVFFDKSIKLSPDAYRVLALLAGHKERDGEVENKALNDYLLKSGFTGKKKDKLGREICYENGRRVACGEKPKPPEVVKPTDKDKLIKDVRRWLGLTGTDVGEAAKDPEVRKQIAEDLGVAPLRVTWALRDLMAAPEPGPEEEDASPYSQRVGGASLQERLQNDAYGKGLVADLGRAALKYGGVREEWWALEAKASDLILKGPKFREAWEAAADEAAAARTEKVRAGALFSQKFYEAVRAAHPAQIGGMRSNYTDAQEAAVQTALGWLNGVVEKRKDEDDPPWLLFDTSLTGRACYYDKASAGGQANVNLGLNSSAATAVHEIGHHLEYTLPGAQAAAQEFLKHRVADEPLVSLAEKFPGCGYESWEQGKKDRFDQAFGERRGYYAGKHYSDGATEVISMGLEALYSDPAHFILNDPEYCQFLLGILSGRLR